MQKIQMGNNLNPNFMRNAIKLIKKFIFFPIILTFLLFSFGCKKESTPGPGVTFNGYTYSTIILGNGQEWMSENLRTTSYSNGDIIPNVTGTQWSSLTTGAWCHYNNDRLYENVYSKLYNWYAVADSRNVCPTGWHVPSVDEWRILIDYLGGDAVAGKKMKSTGTQFWVGPNEATNESGFSALPGGHRFGGGTFAYIGEIGRWWSSNEYILFGGSFDLYSNYDFANIDNCQKEYGLCVRCLRDK
jgi:uncharacterized protein (TIGR02145 family)